MEKYIGATAYDLLAKEIFTLLKTKVGQSELESAIAELASGLAWKGTYETLEALNEAIPEPKEGYFVIITKEPTYENKNTMLIYEAETVNAWQSIGDIFLPGKATTSQDGLMSKEDKTKLDGLTTYTLPVATSSSLGGVKQGDNITISGDGTISTHAPYQHPENHPASIITQDENNRFVTDAEKTKWNQASTDSTSALSQISTISQTANTAKSTADSALTKATTNEGNIGTLEGKVTTVESALNNIMSEEDAQAIINKYKGV